MNSNLMIALAICLAGILLEGLCAGSGVKNYMLQLKWPSFSPPLWVWYIIGLFYYAVMFICAYRLLRIPIVSPLRNAALTLLLLIVVLNAVWNILFFRAKNLGVAFIFSFGYAVVVLACWYCLMHLDEIAARTLGLYVLYLIYAGVWMYRLWRSQSAYA